MIGSRKSYKGQMVFLASEVWLQKHSRHSVCKLCEAGAKGLAIIPIMDKTRSKSAKRWLTVLRPIKHPAPVASQQQTEIASFRLVTTPSSLSLGRPVCLGSCPKRSSEQNQVLDQELAGITQDWKAVSKVRGSRR